jgi:hypothetical protein
LGLYHWSRERAERSWLPGDQGRVRHWQDAGAAPCLLRRLVVDRSRAVPPGRRPGDSGLVSAVWALPARQREVLVLRYFADLPENRVAAATGLSEDAVRSQVALAFSVL